MKTKNLLFLLIYVGCMHQAMAQTPYRGGTGDGYASALLALRPTDLSDPAAEKRIAVYPNPSYSQHALHLTLPFARKEAQLSLIGMEGKEILNFTLPPRGETDFSFQLPRLEMGIYLLKLTTADGWSYTEKLMVNPE